MIGRGGYGNFYLAQFYIKNMFLALKCQIYKERKLAIKREITIFEILNNNPHENIIKFIDEFRHNIYHYFVLELGSTDLKFYILSSNWLKIDKVLIFREILLGCNHLHSLNIIHGDLALRNIVIVDGVPKIIDFGFSTINGAMVKNRFFVNTENITNVAPEIKKGLEYTNKADIWSLGFILYFMLTYSGPKNSCNSPAISLEDIDFLTKLTNNNPESRIDTHAALLDSYFNM